MRRHRTLKEYTAIVANIIYIDGEVTEEELLDKLEDKGISHWTFYKIKIHVLKRLATNYPDIKLNKKMNIYYIYHHENSLSSLSTNQKEGMK